MRVASAPGNVCESVPEPATSVAASGDEVGQHKVNNAAPEHPRTCELDLAQPHASASLPEPPREPGSHSQSRGRRFESFTAHSKNACKWRIVSRELGV